MNIADRGARIVHVHNTHQEGRKMRANENNMQSLMTGAIVLVLCLSLAGCSGCQQPAVLDAAASALNVTVSVLDIAEVPSDGKVIVVMQFFQGGGALEMASTITLKCNGVTLPWNGLMFGHAERVPIQPVGGTYSFTFTRGGVTTTANVTVPARPVFSSPTLSGAMLARSSTFSIHYVPGAGTSIRGGANDASHAANNSQPDDGIHDGLDVSAFVPGPGTLSITRTLEGALTGTGFASAKTKYDTNKTIAITWL
jgi:hypothetical protein